MSIIILVTMYIDSIGTPSIVNNLMSSSNLDEIVLSWEAPFSLNLTSEPDVAYCVDVYNITANNRASCLILSDCNVLTTHFVYNSSHPNPRDRFQFIVIPRSNMAGARNGTPSQPIVASFLGIVTMLKFFFYYYNPLFTTTVHPNICVESITFNTSTVFNRGKLHLAFGFPNWVTILWLCSSCMPLISCMHIPCW